MDVTANVADGDIGGASAPRRLMVETSAELAVILFNEGKGVELNSPGSAPKRMDGFFEDGSSEATIFIEERDHE
jgi:hypothetical protein